MVKYLPDKYKALSSNPILERKRKRRKRKGGRKDGREKR
jgi:hypothetical protein